MRASSGNFVLATVAAVLVALCSGHLRANESDSAVLLKLNRQIMEDTILRQDPSTLLEHAHPDYRVVAPGGRVETKEETAAGATSIVAKGMEITQEQVHIAGDTAVVIGKIDVDGVMKPVGKMGPGKFMAVFTRQDGEWKILSRALTPCKQIAIDHGFC